MAEGATFQNPKIVSESYVLLDKRPDGMQPPSIKNDHIERMPEAYKCQLFTSPTIPQRMSTEFVSAHNVCASCEAPW